MTERSPGVWWLRAYARRSTTGKAPQVSRTLHGGKRLARAELAKLVTEVAERAGQMTMTPLTRGMTVTELLERWLEYLTPFREPGTIRGYRQHSKAITAAFGSVQVSKLNAQQMDRACRTWLGQGRAARTVRQRHAIMSSALHQAQRWGLVARAVTTWLRRPRSTLDRGPPRIPPLSVSSSAQLRRLSLRCRRATGRLQTPRRVQPENRP